MIEELRERGWTLGGEQSGHVIWTDFAPTGDGIAAALLTLRALGERDLGRREPFEKLPQTLENVEVADRGALEDARRSGRRSSGERGARGPRAGAGAAVRHRAAGAGDGRGARRRRSATRSRAPCSSSVWPSDELG